MGEVNVWNNNQYLWNRSFLDKYPEWSLWCPGWKWDIFCKKSVFVLPGFFFQLSFSDYWHRKFLNLTSSETTLFSERRYVMYNCKITKTPREKKSLINVFGWHRTHRVRLLPVASFNILECRMLRYSVTKILKKKTFLLPKMISYFHRGRDKYHWITLSLREVTTMTTKEVLVSSS